MHNVGCFTENNNHKKLSIYEHEGTVPDFRSRFHFMEENLGCIISVFGKQFQRQDMHSDVRSER